MKRLRYTRSDGGFSTGEVIITDDENAARQVARQVAEIVPDPEPPRAEPAQERLETTKPMQRYTKKGR